MVWLNTKGKVCGACMTNCMIEKIDLFSENDREIRENSNEIDNTRFFLGYCPRPTKK